MKLIALTALLYLSACSSQEKLGNARHEIVQFHSQLNRGEYEEIYAASDAGFKKATSKTEMVKLLAGVHAKMGAFKQGHQAGWRVNYNTTGNSTVVQFKSVYEKGEAVETFTFVGTDTAPRLYSYNISSKALLPG